MSRRASPLEGADGLVERSQVARPDMLGVAAEVRQRWWLVEQEFRQPAVSLP